MTAKIEQKIEAAIEQHENRLSEIAEDHGHGDLLDNLKTILQTQQRMADAIEGLDDRVHETLYLLCTRKRYHPDGARITIRNGRSGRGIYRYQKHNERIKWTRLARRYVRRGLKKADEDGKVKDYDAVKNILDGINKMSDADSIYVSADSADYPSVRLAATTTKIRLRRTGTPAYHVNHKMRSKTPTPPFETKHKFVKNVEQLGPVLNKATKELEEKEENFMDAVRTIKKSGRKYLAAESI